MEEKELEARYQEQYGEMEHDLLMNHPKQVVDEFKKRVMEGLRGGRMPSGPAILALVLSDRRPRNHYNPEGVKFVT